MRSFPVVLPVDVPMRPFQQFLEGGPLGRGTLRAAMTAVTRSPETELLPPLLAQARLSPTQAQATQTLALRLVQQLRQRKPWGLRSGLAQELLQEYALSSEEGVALMCLAEALLRIPDPATRNALIRDKMRQGQWARHLGHSPSLFVNAATWGLMLTGELLAPHSESGWAAMLWRLLDRGGEPLVRAAVNQAMRLLGEQFVAGQTIAEALSRASGREDQGLRHSYDMLGEAALTAADARHYQTAYAHAIHAIGQASAGRGIYKGPGLSIKLSALHPRYCRAQLPRVLGELYPALLHLVQLARRYDIGINIDAEEAERLDLSLDLLGRLCHEPALAGWNGIGFVVQAYQKRSLLVVQHLIELARHSGHRLMVRLVKGAYWDSEIKRAQVEGQSGYPVYTRKVYTDLAYLACARQLLAAPDAAYPQFATHNAHTLAAIYQLADPARYTPQQYEFQCLYGMGEGLYQHVVGPKAQGRLDRTCRIYAPVGTHDTLLAYLVRRLLENGANSSFVHRLADPSLDAAALVDDPVRTALAAAAQAGGMLGQPHPAIPLPSALYSPQRLNAQGLDLQDEAQLQRLWGVLRTHASTPWVAHPMLAQEHIPQAPARRVHNPADQRDELGRVHEATASEVRQALAEAAAYASAPPSAASSAGHWPSLAPAERAACLLRAAALLQDEHTRLLALLMREAGKTCASALAEVREAIDSLRYSAAQIQAMPAAEAQQHRPLGVLVCISPWNFPLAIFLGQVGAALAAGNVVLAKPAEQTPLVAAVAVRLLRRAGLPPQALQLLPGPGLTVGAQLVDDPRVQGVLFTGSNPVARLLQQQLAKRLDARGQPVTLIAETGGQNAMLVDSSALLEQVVTDALHSAFDSAGQRCSALRLLCVQADVADRLLDMLQGAMAELRVGNPDRLAVDVGPVIDSAARDMLLRYITQHRAAGRVRYQSTRGYNPQSPHGTLVPPTLIELAQLSQLGPEVFGPVLHLLRYPQGGLPELLTRINALGYGLTLGLHTRIDETVAHVIQHARVGNLYINRNMVGAVVGVQPFGGEGLSGTGPKAGGPLYLYRLLAHAPADVMRRAVHHASAPGPSPDPSPGPSQRGGGTPAPALQALADWADTPATQLGALCRRYAELSWATTTCTLPGPTGETNTYTLHPRSPVLCLADTEADLLTQLAAVLAVGSQALWPAEAAAPLFRQLPPLVQAQITLVPDDAAVQSPGLGAVLHHGSLDRLRVLTASLAERPGPIVTAQSLVPGSTAIRLERLVVERVVSINTAAAGGNTHLMGAGSD
jgi:RHH-type proline utilization regulon transcriptional repressor/proline dehydrogenase/delta 1-pyrroline-5-carboxylate dehydrogenase